MHKDRHCIKPNKEIDTKKQATLSEFHMCKTQPTHQIKHVNQPTKDHACIIVPEYTHKHGYPHASYMEIHILT